MVIGARVHVALQLLGIAGLFAISIAIVYVSSRDQPADISGSGRSSTDQRLLVDVRDHGARGDGVHNDTAAIIQAIQYAASGDHPGILLPAGVYAINASSYWDPVEPEIELLSGLEMVGEGRDLTRIRIIPESISAYSNLAGVTLHDNTRIADLTIDGSRDRIERDSIESLNMHAVRVQPWESENVTIENLRIHDVIGVQQESFGIMLNGLRNGEIRNVEAFNIEGSGIHIDGHLYERTASDIVVTGVTVHHNDWAGISVYAAEDIDLQHVLAYQNQFNGLNIEWSDRIEIRFLESIDNGLSGVGTFGDGGEIFLTDARLSRNGWHEFASAIGAGQIGLRVGDYHQADPETGEIPRGLVRSLRLGAVDIQTSDQNAYLSIHHDGDRPDPESIVTVDGDTDLTEWEITFSSPDGP